MGVVVAATHLELEQRVALKFLREGAFNTSKELERFRREARAAVKLRSEHVARVLDTGTLENGSPYIVMEYLEGTDLAAEVRQSGALPVAAVAEYVIHACDAIAEAHANGIVHRDLKPANLFLTRRNDGSPLVKVLDFGISKVNALGDAGAVAITRTSAMMGTPYYMSPEQMKSAKDVDGRTDVWSLGVILYELLAGRVPFMFDTLGALLAMVMMDPHAPLSKLRPDVPPSLERLVDGCLQKDIAQRVPTVAHIALALAEFCPARSLPIVQRISSVLGVLPGNAAPNLAPATARLNPAPVAPPPPAPVVPQPPAVLPQPDGATARGWSGAPTTGAHVRGSGWKAGVAIAGAAALVGIASALFIAMRRPPPRDEPLIAARASAPTAETTPAPAAPAIPSAAIAARADEDVVPTVAVDAGAAAHGGGSSGTMGMGRTSGTVNRPRNSGGHDAGPSAPVVPPAASAQPSAKSDPLGTSW